LRSAVSAIKCFAKSAQLVAIQSKITHFVALLRFGSGSTPSAGTSLVSPISILSSSANTRFLRTNSAICPSIGSDAFGSSPFPTVDFDGVCCSRPPNSSLRTEKEHLRGSASHTSVHRVSNQGQTGLQLEDQRVSKGPQQEEQVRTVGNIIRAGFVIRAAFFSQKAGVAPTNRTFLNLMRIVRRFEISELEVRTPSSHCPQKLTRYSCHVE
jgi:hypothetical protein